VRLLKQSAKPFTPRVYQEKAVEFLLHNGAAALFADMGTGKTAATLAAVSALLESGVAQRVLVIAPRRVCQLTWWQESQEWREFTHLRFAWLHNSRPPWKPDGPLAKKEKELARQDADIWLINPEGVAWLYEQYKHRPSEFPFDTVVVDELTKFKNHMSDRSKKLRKLTSKTARVWGLTGTPTPNGYEDLFGQILLLDGGNSLGYSIRKFRDKYFQPDGFAGYDYKLAPGADKRIEEAIAPLVLRIAAEDWIDMPQKIDNLIRIKLDPKSKKAYDTLKKEMLLQVEGGAVEAANAAGLYSKLAQLANGRVYANTEAGSSGRRVIDVHGAKIEALDDLVSELNGAALLVTYEFNHDLDQLKEWHEKRFGKPLRYLGKGTTDAEAYDIQDDWNANAIDVLAVHPVSAGHGLNFQKGGAQHICHFSAVWDFEVYDQVIARICRQGNTADHIINHLLLVDDSIDELKYAALLDKDSTQERFLQSINTAFKSEATQQESDMAFEKLKRKAEAAQAAPAQQQAPTTPPAKQGIKGWDAPAKASPPEAAEPTQEEKIEQKLTNTTPRAVPVETAQQPAEAPISAAFSSETQALMQGGLATPSEKTPEQSAPFFNGVLTDPCYHINVCVGVNDNGDPEPRIEVSYTGSGDGEALKEAAKAAAKAAEEAFNSLCE